MNYFKLACNAPLSFNRIIKNFVLCALCVTFVGCEDGEEGTQVKFDESFELVQVFCDSQFPVESLDEFGNVLGEVIPANLSFEEYQDLNLDKNKYFYHYPCTEMIFEGENNTTVVVRDAGVIGSVQEANGIFMTSFSSIIEEFGVFSGTIMMDNPDIGSCLEVGYGPEDPETKEPKWRLHTVLQPEGEEAHIAGLTTSNIKLGAGCFTTNYFKVDIEDVETGIITSHYLVDIEAGNIQFESESSGNFYEVKEIKSIYLYAY